MKIKVSLLAMLLVSMNWSVYSYEASKEEQETEVERDRLGRLLIKAVKDGSLDKVQELLRARANVNGKNEFGSTPLISASQRGDLEMIKVLLSFGANINHRNNFGETALMIAACIGNLDIVKELLKAGADVEVKNNNGWTTLMIAARNANLDIVKELLAAGADIEAKNTEGETALILAREMLDPAPNMSGEHVEFSESEEDVEISKIVELSEVVELLEVYEKVYDALDVRLEWREFKDEPVLESYIKGDMSEESDEQALDAFNKDLQDYWVYRLQSAYSIFIDTRDPQPLIDFFCNEMWQRKGLMPIIFSSFKSKDHLQALLSFLINKARTEEEKQKLQKLQDIEAQVDATAAENANKSPMEIYKSIDEKERAAAAANKIQSAWRSYQFKKQYDEKERKELFAELPHGW